MTEFDLKNILALINRVPNISGAEVETVAELKKKINDAIASFHTPPSMHDDAPKPTTEAV